MRREEGRSREADSWAAARLPAGTSPLSIHVEVETKSLWIQSKAFSHLEFSVQVLWPSSIQGL